VIGKECRHSKLGGVGKEENAGENHWYWHFISKSWMFQGKGDD
jgi:hypothetical protein